MTASKRFSGLMGAPEPAPKAETPAPAVTESTPGAAPVISEPVPAADQKITPVPDAPGQPTKAKVQMNTQQPEDLKNAADKAAAYLTFTTGKKVTTTDVVEQALRAYLKQFPEAVMGKLGNIA